MIVAVTGGRGFIGSHLVDRLRARGDEVRVISRQPAQQSSKLQHYCLDYSDVESLSRVFEGCDVVFHLASALRTVDPRSIVDENVALAGYVSAALLRTSNQPKLIVCSSQAAVGTSGKLGLRTDREMPSPVSWYGRSKLAADNLFLSQYPTNIVIVRPPAVFGPRERDIFVFLRTLVKRKTAVKIGSVKRTFSWIYIDDLIEALLVASRDKSLAGKGWLVKSGDTDWDEFRVECAGILSIKPLVIPVPTFVFGLLAYFADRKAKRTGKPQLLNPDKVSELQHTDWRCDDTSFRIMTGFKPQYTLHDALQKTLDWYRQEGWF